MTTSQATRLEDIKNRAAVGAASLRGKAPVCVEITSKTRVGKGVVLMCKACCGTFAVFHLSWDAIPCSDCDTLADKIGGYWLLKRPTQ